MAWPFTTVNQPNLDSTPGVAIPSPASTALFTGQLWLLGAHLTNPTAGEATVTLTDTAGGLLCEVIIPGGGEMPYEWPFRPAVGVKWFSTVAGCKGHVWGYF